MAAVDDDHICNLRWVINYPFVTWRAVRALFFDGAPNSYRWVATIEPTGRDFNTWYFSFTLECIDAHHEVIEPREVWIRFSINNTPIKEIFEEDLAFHAGLPILYRLDTFACMPPQTGPAPLTVEISITLTGNDQQNWIHPMLRESDASSLSIDLRRVFESGVYTNTRLRSIDDVDFNVHSYILEARWTNFVMMARLFGGAPPDPMIIDVPHLVLHDILIYLYSGIVDTGAPKWRSLLYVGQVFHVIFSYNIPHLYRVFVNDYSEQRQEIVRNARSSIFYINIDDLLRLPRNGSIGKRFNENNLQFLFELRVHSERSRWLTYSLVSQTQSRLYVEVSLEAIQRKLVFGGHLHSSRHIGYLHEGEHVLNPHETETSGFIICLESLEIFGNLRKKGGKNLLKEEYQNFIRCFIKFTDRTETLQIGSIFNIYQEYSEICNTLCDHMERSLLNTFDGADLEMIAFNRPPNQEYQDVIAEADVYMMYKAIFEIRVPNWREVIEDFIEENDIIMPNEVRMTLQSQVIPFIRSYLCTGRVTAIPHSYLDDIENFARMGGCQSLEDLVARARLHPPIDDL